MKLPRIQSDNGHVRVSVHDLIGYAVLLAAILGQWYALNSKLDRWIEVSDTRYRAAADDRQRIWDVLVRKAIAEPPQPKP